MASWNTNEVMKIKAMLEEGQPRFKEECCIYRVPHEIRKFNEDAYTPKVVSIELEPKVCSCYSDNIKLSEEEHVRVILVDCCFILELLLKYHFNQRTSHDAIFLSPWLQTYVDLDLVLLENQVPFFVLEKLFNLDFPSTLNSGNPSHPSLLLRLALVYKVPHSTIPGYIDELTLTGVGNITHFTDLSRKFLLASSHLFQPSASGCSRQAQLTQLYSATELKEAGVKFEVNKNSKCLLDLEITGHTLRIPFTRVHDWTEVVLRNLLAFEQCHCISQSYLADYIFFLDFLINTEKDVDLLIKKGIIENWLGDSNAVATMFNSLAVNLVNVGFNVKYSCIFKGLNAFCKKPWNRKVATLKRDYCNTPWKTVASIAGIFLLILTVIQTVFSIFQGMLNDFCNHPWNKKVATLKLDYCNTPWKIVASIAGIFLLILTIIQTGFSILQVVLA
nr:UPF0481 protein At3g47200-like [Arachis hypogaea]